MQALVTGNMGYVGPQVVARLRATRPGIRLSGLDAGYFAHCRAPGLPDLEGRVDNQHFADVRSLEPGFFRGIDSIVHLAAISNDPIGNAFTEATWEINHRASIELARQARDEGVRSFVFASSCSVYGTGSDVHRSEQSPVDPLTAYAQSKLAAEADLLELADDDFAVTCLRFATACGFSDRIRLDLVLNDFVASALVNGSILILSDGTPWRPLIHVRDMARAIDWALDRSATVGGPHLVLNVGTSSWNYQVRELAEAVAEAVPGAEIVFAADGGPDPRSYRVGFDLFKSLAPESQPKVGLEEAIDDLLGGLADAGFGDPNFHSSRLIRLVALEELRREGRLTAELRWALPTRSLVGT